MEFTIYHNPQWGKSRRSLELLKENSIEFEIVEYLKTPLTMQNLKSVSLKLGLSPKDFTRKNDSKYKELNLDRFNGTDEEMIEIIIKHPRILERPIITSKEKAVIGRPPENILKLL